MDIKSAIYYIFDDEDCVPKVGIGALLLLVPVLGFAAFGYEARVIRNLVRGEAQPLPTWDDFGTMFMDGLWLGLARFIYSLPIVALLVCSVAVTVPYFYLAESESQMQERLPLILMVCGGAFLILVIYAAILGFFSPAMTIQYVRRGTFAACFDFGAIFRLIRRNFGDYLTLWAVIIGINLVLGLILFVVSFFINIIPCLGSIAQILLINATTFWVLLIAGHLQAQLIRADDARGAV
jgi:hypothetical protein